MISALSLQKFFRQHWQVLVFTAFGAILRLWNLTNSMYFIYDQGRDALVLQKIASGDPVLVGPTSGLQGFFLGPLWYYLGLPGYFLSNGHPVGIAAWYIFASCSTLPLIWWLMHRLFTDKRWAVGSAFLLSILPGAIQASTFVWNPLMAAPLMLAMVFAFWKAHTYTAGKLAGLNWWLVLGFFCLALTLQSEFAYAVFFLPVLLILIPWIAPKWHWKDVVAVIVAIGVTGLPQLLFEVRNSFLMITSLLRGMTDHSHQISWAQLMSQRPQQLWEISSEILLGPGQTNTLLFKLLAVLFVLGAIGILSQWHNKKLWLWKLVLILAILPYPFYMMWRGNDGNFFPYYLTPHFVFLFPIMANGVFWLREKMLKQKMMMLFVNLGILLTFGALVTRSWHHWNDAIAHPNNNAGYAKMQRAVDHIFAWRAENSTDPFVVRTFTKNVYTEQYDYLLQRYARTQNEPKPKSTRDGSEKSWFILIESRPAENDFFFQPWYYEATKGGTLKRALQSGVVTVEEWGK